MVRATAHASVWRTMTIVGAPLTLAVLEIFHPHPHDLLHIPLARWMIVHYAQLPLFPLAAWSQAALTHDQDGYAASLARVAMFVFAVSFVAFDTAAGVVTGVLVQAAQASGSPEAWRSAILAVWDHPIVGGSNVGAPALAVIGTLAWLAGTLLTAVVSWRVRRFWPASVLLLVSAFGLGVFRTHAWPGGPVTFGSFAAAAALLEWPRRLVEERR